MIVAASTSPRPSRTVWVAALLALALGAGLIVPVAGPRVAAMVIGGMVALAGAVFAPGVVFGLYLLIPFYKGAVQAYVPIDLTVILAALNTLQVVALLVHRPRGPRSSVGIALWFVLAMLVLGGVLYAADQPLALGHAVTYWLLMAIPLALGAYRVGSDPRHVRQLLWTFFGMGVLTTLVGVPSFANSERLTVLGANTINVASAALLVPLVGLTFVARDASARLRLVTVILIPAALIVALATGSRGPMLVLFLVAIPAIVRGLAHLRSPDWPRTAAVAGAGLAIVIIVSLASNNLPALSTSRFASLGDFVASAIAGDQVDPATTDTSATARVSFFGAAATMFEERPLAGFGTAGFEALSHRLLGQDEAYPHNAVLQFAAEFGLLGLALFVALVLLGLIRSLPRGASPVRILFVFFLAQAMLSGDIFSDRTTWGLLLVILLLEVPSVAHAGSDTPRAGPGVAVLGAGAPGA